MSAAHTPEPWVYETVRDVAWALLGMCPNVPSTHPLIKIRESRKAAIAGRGAWDVFVKAPGAARGRHLYSVIGGMHAPLAQARGEQ